MMSLFLCDWQNFRKAERNVFLIVEIVGFLLPSLPLDEDVFP